MDDPQGLLELETRRRIYEHVRRVPGLHLRALQRATGLPLGTVEYHLHQMERAGLVVTREEGRYKAYFPNDQLDRRDRDVLYYLRQDMPRRIALEIANRPGLTFRELAERLPIGESTLSFHLKKLRAAGLVDEQRQGREKAYSAVDGDRIRSLIVRYRATFLDDVVDRFAASWFSLGVR